MSEHTLNKKQLEAVNSKKNSIVIAGAGAGKTKVFTEKYKRLLKEVDTTEILALTYTDKASSELKDRLDLDYTPYLGTFHSVFNKIYNDYVFDLVLLENYPLEGFDRRLGNIYEEYKYKEYLENNFYSDIFVDKEFKAKVKNIHKLDDFINDNLEICLVSDTYKDYIVNLDKAFSKTFKYSDKKIVSKFSRTKKRDKVLNFNDIIIEMYFFIKEHKNIRNRISNDFKYIMVDEFQDTNKIVLEIINMISNNNIFYVGDTLQSIYSFQGADYNIINEIIENSDNLIQLDINYRSSKNIVNLANDFINSSLNKSDKIKAVKESGLVKNNSIKVIENITDYTIPEIINNSKNNLEDICILTRTNNEIKEIKSILDKHNIPYDRKDFKEVEIILNTLLLMITKNYEPEDKYFKRFNIKKWQEIIKEKSTKQYITNYIEIIKEIWNEENLDSYFVNRSILNIKDSKNIWLDRIMKAFNFDTYLFLNSIISRIELYLKNEEYVSKKGVKIFTIHKSKGLEWEEVILYNQEDNVFPKDLKNQEEARLFYVAITRAKSELYITSKKLINTYTKRFLNNDYIEHITYKRDKEYIFNASTKIEDIIDFSGSSIIEFMKIEEEKYKGFTDKKVINQYIKTTNRLLQDEKIQNINIYTVEEVEAMIFDIRDIQNNNDIDYIPLKSMVKNIDTNKDLFFNGEEINYNYLNNDFTDIIHDIINYRNLMTDTELEEEPKENDQFIRKFGKIVKKFVSKKNTDLTKDKSKKSLEIQERKIENKINDSELINHEETVLHMKREYYKNSDTQKKFYNKEVLGMYDTLNNRNMVDFENYNNERKLEETLIDYEGNIYTEETLKGKFLNDSKKNKAFKVWSKLKYLEYMAIGQRGAFLTFTSQGHNHKWKMKEEALRNKSLRNYGDNSILEINPNFIMRGDNFIEHIRIVAKEMKEITTNFYEVLKSKIAKFEKKNGYKSGHFKLRQLEQVEPHKGLIPHEHEIIFLDEEVFHFIEEAFNFVIEKYNLNPKYQDTVIFDKKEDTEKGRNLLKKADLEDKISLLEEENEIIIAIKENKYLLKDENFRLLVSEKSRAEIKQDLKVLRKNIIWNEYKILIKELKKITKWLDIEEAPLLEKRNEIFDKLFCENDEDKRKEIETELEEFDLNNFRETANVSSYVAKYVMKGAFSSEEEDTEDSLNEVMFFNAYINMLGNTIRTTTMTNYNHTTQKNIDKMYLWFQEHNPEKLEYLKGLNKPLYVSLEEFELKGEFKFIYERKVKENFKNADYIKDIDIEYQELKRLYPKTNIKELWQIAMNTVLNNDNDYINIHTEKKLIEVCVKEEFIINNTTPEAEVKEIMFYTIEDNPHKDWFSLEEEVKMIMDNRFSNMREINEIMYKTIYIEDMYIKSEIKIEELREYYVGDIEKAREQYKNYYNHKDKIREEETVYYSPPIDILELMIA